MKKVETSLRAGRGARLKDIEVARRRGSQRTGERRAWLNEASVVNALADLPGPAAVSVSGIMSIQLF